MTLPLSPDELLTTTRSVRKRLDLDRPVPRELVEECITVALQAPTGSNAQSWHWLIVTDTDLRARIGELYADSFARYRASGSSRRHLEGASDERVATQGRVTSSADHLAEVMGRVPVLVIAAMQTGELPGGNQAGLWGSLLPAAWSYQLAARSRGLGTAWTTLHLAHEREIAELLGIPDGVRQGVLLPTAYYTGDTFKPAPREPLAAVVHHNRWHGR